MTEFTKTFRRTTYSAISPSSPSNDESGKTILVIGGSEGIGFGVANAFAEAHALKIIVVSRSQTKLDLAYKTIRNDHSDVEVETRVFDVSEVAQIEDLWTHLASNGIFVDVLVQGAAATRPPNGIEDQISMINFNIAAQIHILEGFKNQANPNNQPKCLINLSSATIHCYPYEAATYAATKVAFGNYLCHIADYIPESEMRIIIYHPGSVYTSAAERASEVPKTLPIWDHPSLSAHTAVWLAGRDAGFLHGRFVWANWDVDELKEMKEKILADPAFLKVGITGLDSFGVPKLMDVCTRFPAPED